MCKCVCLCTCMCFLCFLFVFSSAFCPLSYSYFLLLLLFYLIVLSCILLLFLGACLFSKKQQKVCESGWRGRQRRTGKSRCMGNSEHDTLYENNIFLIKEKLI